jgi:hypothetical protein
LRETLIYRNPNFYYIVSIINLLFRFFWILNVSNITSGTYSLFIKIKISRNDLGLILCIIEMMRRILWNLLRVEKEHIGNCGKLNAVPKVNYDSIIEKIEFKIQNIRSNVTIMDEY